MNNDKLSLNSASLRYNQIMDRRLRKTEDAIQNALIDLVSKNGYEGLKMIDVIEKADINKSTFYLHYQSLLGVSSAIEDKLIAKILDAIHEEPTAGQTTIGKVVEVFSKERKSFKTVLSISEGHLYRKLENNLMPVLNEVVSFKGDKENINYQKAALFGSLFGIVRCYILGSSRLDTKKLEDQISKLLELS